MHGSSAAKPPSARGEDGQPSATARQLIDLLRPHTPFAEAIVKRQIERAGLSLAYVTEGDLAVLAPLIFAASAVFLDPPARDALKRSLKLRA